MNGAWLKCQIHRVLDARERQPVRPGAGRTEATTEGVALAREPRSSNQWNRISSVSSRPMKETPGNEAREGNAGRAGLEGEQALVDHAVRLVRLARAWEMRWRT